MPAEMRHARIFANSAASDRSVYLIETAAGLELDIDGPGPLELTDYAAKELRKALQRYEKGLDL
jgi:hypothetical protein